MSKTTLIEILGSIYDYAKEPQSLVGPKCYIIDKAKKEIEALMLTGEDMFNIGLRAIIKHERCVHEDMTFSVKQYCKMIEAITEAQRKKSQGKEEGDENINMLDIRT